MNPMIRGGERAWVWAFAAFAGLRVLASCALFPFFDNVDEIQHYDLVVKYSRAELPAALERYGDEAARSVARYATDEYLVSPERDARIRPRPLAAHPPEEAAEYLPIAVGIWTTEINIESQEPPFYYALAGGAYALARALGLEGMALLFWLRALNALPAMLLVLVGHAAARAAFPASRVQRLGVPLLLAVFPQDAAYSIGADVLSPLCFGVAYLGLLSFFAREAPSRAAAVRTGLALAATGLTKTANLPLVGVAGIALLWRARSLGPRRVALALACAGLPLAAWFAANQLRFGDWTGSAAKIAVLTWTRKPPTEWLPHPLFGAAGLAAFWPELLASFWRGEFVWYRERLAFPALDAFYWISSTGLLAVALARLPAQRESRAALVTAAWCFASVVGFLVLLSLAFDFGTCFYPSRARPYFSSGRLLGGALIPFLLLYVHGLDTVLGRWSGERARWLALAAIALAITASELWLDRAPFASPYNVLHLGG